MSHVNKTAVAKASAGGLTATAGGITAVAGASQKDSSKACSDPSESKPKDDSAKTSIPNPSVHRCRPGMRSLQWVPASNGDIPEFAVRGSDDCPEMFVGRTWHKDDLLPGKVIAKDGCYVAIFGSDNRHVEYEVLTNPKNCKLTWVHTKKGDLHPRAVPGGYAMHGISYYIGRHLHKGKMVVGKVQPTYHQCWIPYEGKEYNYHEYEVLVCETE